MLLRYLMGNVIYHENLCISPNYALERHCEPLAKQSKIANGLLRAKALAMTTKTNCIVLL